MGYREYLKNNRAQQPDLLDDVRNRFRKALSKVGSLHRQWLAEIQQIRTVPPRQDEEVQAEAPLRRDGTFLSHDDALAALFPNRITSFFPDAPEPEDRLENLGEESLGEESPGLENIEEDPVLAEMEKPVSRGGDESLERIRAAFQRLTRPAAATEEKKASPLVTELKRVMDQELSVGKGGKPAPPRRRIGNALLDERRLDRINEKKFQLLLKNNKSLSNNINRLADSYFSRKKPDEEGSWIPGI